MKFPLVPNTNVRQLPNPLFQNQRDFILPLPLFQRISQLPGQDQQNGK